MFQFFYLLLNIYLNKYLKLKKNKKYLNDLIKRIISIPNIIVGVKKPKDVKELKGKTNLGLDVKLPGIKTPTISGEINSKGTNIDFPNVSLSLNQSFKGSKTVEIKNPSIQGQSQGQEQYVLPSLSSIIDSKKLEVKFTSNTNLQRSGTTLPN